MPGIDGARSIDFVQHQQPGISIVILSGNMTREQMAETVRRGAAGVIEGSHRQGAHRSARAHSRRRECRRPVGVGRAAFRASSPQGKHGESWKHFNLTPREIEVARLLARGMRNKTIAHSLGIADITVRLHLRNAFRKMGAGNRADAVRIAMRSRLFN